MTDIPHITVSHKALQNRSDDSESTGSISLLIKKLRTDADQEAAHDIYVKYFDQLVIRLRHRINRKVHSIGDSEDAAQFALAEVLNNILEGRYPDLANREGLWALMVHIGDMRTKQVWRMATADRRDVRRLKPLNSTPAQDSEVTPALFDPDCDSIPVPMLVEVEDMVGYLIQRFSKTEYKDILSWELQGYTAPEIKEKLEQQLQRHVADSSLRRWRRLMRAELRANYPGEFPAGAELL